MRWYEPDEYTVHNDREVKGFQGEYRWLSNFWKADTEYEDMLFPTSENAYQAAKLMDAHLRVPFQSCTPAQAKKKWKEYPDFLLQEDWNEVKVPIMYDILMDKFIRNKDLGIKLIGTGNKYLEETNAWHDKFWGVYKGTGTNWLGKLLMHVREEIRDEYLPF